MAPGIATFPTSRSEGDAKPCSYQAHESRALGRILDNVGAKPAGFAAGDGSVKSESHPARKEDKWLALWISDIKRTFASQGASSGQHGNVPLF
jgi:hypothetical protein